MSTTKVWSIKLFLTEDAHTTQADAVLKVGDRQFRGEGIAWRHPADPDVSVIGEELAVTRALTMLSHQILRAATSGIEELEDHKTLTGS